MKQQIVALTLVGLAGLLAGCRTSSSDTEPGPDKTIAYYLKVECSEPGVSIETNKVFAGMAPLSLKLFGDVPGTFHNFGSPEFMLQALPLRTNQFLQTKVFKTGKHSNPGERIPGLVFFNMNQPNSGLIIDSIPDK